MEQADIVRLALVLAIQAEIEGMKAENQRSNVAGVDPAYSAYDFNKKAEDLRNLAYCHNEQL